MQDRLLLVDSEACNIPPGFPVDEACPDLATEGGDDDGLAIVRWR